MTCARLRSEVRSPGLGVLGMVLMLLLVPCCAKLIGADEFELASESTDSGPSGPRTRCGDFAASEPGCGACLDVRCCDALERCADDPGCTPLAACFAACEGADETCRVRCVDAHHSRSSEASRALVECSVGRCAAECSQCGAVALAYPESCAECMVTSCCAAARECAGDPGCAGIAACMANDLSPYTFHDCVANVHTTGAYPRWQALEDCRLGACAPECAGRAFGCAGEHVVPETTERVLRLGYYFVNANLTPAVGVTVRSCLFTDLDCSNPLGEGVTDGAGTVSLVSRTRAEPFVGYVQTLPRPGDPWRGQVIISAPTISPDTVILPFADAAFIGLLESTGQTTLNPALAQALVFAIDCTGRIAEGTTLEVDPAVEVVPFVETLAWGGNPGPGWLLPNVEPGSYEIVIREGNDGKGREVSHLSARLVASTLASIAMFPDRRPGTTP